MSKLRRPFDSGRLSDAEKSSETLNSLPSPIAREFDGKSFNRTTESRLEPNIGNDMTALGSARGKAVNGLDLSYVLSLSCPGSLDSLLLEATLAGFDLV